MKTPLSTHYLRYLFCIGVISSSACSSEIIDDPIGGGKAGEVFSGIDGSGGYVIAGERNMAGVDSPIGEEITGGEIMGGEIMGGEVMGGEVMGGEVMGGEVMGGEVMGGEVMGGEVMGGALPPLDQPAWVTMCQRWRTVQSALEGVLWTGDVNQCIAGDVNEVALSGVVELTNFYRSLADLDPVTGNLESVPALQECALMMQANGRLSHSPPAEWRCYTPEGAQKASRSNIAGSNAIDAIGMYMVDPGNETTMGHRRWIMSIGLESIGVGSASDFSCMEVLHLNRPQGWVAFPSPGPFPIQVSEDRWGRSIDQTGWTFQYDGLSLRDPQVSVTAFDLPDPTGAAVGQGVDCPIEVVTLRPNFGSAAALNLIPQGWTSEVGKRYVVRVEGESESIQYEVDIVDCGLAP